jgi:hypothetical protein
LPERLVELQSVGLRVVEQQHVAGQQQGIGAGLLHAAGASPLHHEGVDVACFVASDLRGVAADPLRPCVDGGVDPASRGPHIHACVERLSHQRLGIHRHVHRADHFAPEAGSLAGTHPHGIELQIHGFPLGAACKASWRVAHTRSAAAHLASAAPLRQRRAR